MTTRQVSREAVVQTAYRLFAEGGYGALSMRSVADRLGVTAPALYRHFDNKSDLFASVLERGFGGMTARLASALSARTPRNRLRTAVEGLLEFAIAEPRVYEALAYPGDEPEIRDVVLRLHAQARTAFQFLQDRVRECMSAGVLRRDDTETVALVLWSHSHGLITMYLSGHVNCTEREFRELFWECWSRVARGLTEIEVIDRVGDSDGSP